MINASFSRIWMFVKHFAFFFLQYYTEKKIGVIQNLFLVSYNTVQNFQKCSPDTVEVFLRIW